MASYVEIYGESVEDPCLEYLDGCEDAITDYRYNYDHELLGLDLTRSEGERIADQIERDRLSFELETLFRWWALK